MKVVNDLIKVPELNQTMQQMSKEMMKAGLIEETMGEMMDDAFDTDDIEEDADAEVDKVRLPSCWAAHAHACCQDKTLIETHSGLCIPDPKGSKCVQ